MSAPRKLPGKFDAAMVEALRLTQEVGEVRFFWYDGVRRYYILGVAEQGFYEGSTHVAPGDTLQEARKRYLDKHYEGAADLPKWWQDGVEVRVKATPEMRRTGLRTAVGDNGSGDAVAWPNERGTIARNEGDGWWCWTIVFSRGRHAVRVAAEMVKHLARVPTVKEVRTFLAETKREQETT